MNLDNLGRAWKFARQYRNLVPREGVRAVPEALKLDSSRDQKSARLVEGGEGSAAVTTPVVDLIMVRINEESRLGGGEGGAWGRFRVKRIFFKQKTFTKPS